MDIKIDGINRQILEEALAQAKKGRTEIMENMMSAIAEVRPEVSQYAPKMVNMMIPVDKIREVIGTGGKVINQIIAECDNVKIDIEDDGTCVIYHSDAAALKKAKQMIENIIREAKVGEIFEGKVVRIEKFGAFVNLFGDTDGLLHVSKIAWERVEKPEDRLNLGDVIRVVVTEIDDKGRVNVSARDLLEKPADYVEPQRREKPQGEKRVFKKKEK